MATSNSFGGIERPYAAYEERGHHSGAEADRSETPAERAAAVRRSEKLDEEIERLGDNGSMQAALRRAGIVK